jgi:hypothetical protein
MTSGASRFARSVLLLVGSAVLAVVVAVTTTPRFVAAKVPPLDSLPWNAVNMAAPHSPVALLYVQSRCIHCSAAASALDSLTRTGPTHGIVMTSDSLTAARAYRAKLSLREPIALDTSRAMMHVLQIHSVPTLIVFASDGSRHLLVGFRGPRPYGNLLRSVQ